MNWKLSFTKDSGKPRKQFAQWKVPKEIAEQNNLKDGDVCTLRVRSGTIHFSGEVTLTSGSEFRLPNVIAKRMTLLSAKKPKGQITFELLHLQWKSIIENFESEVATSISLTPDQRQRRLDTAEKTPRRVEVLTTKFRRNPDVVAQVLYLADGICHRCKKPAPFKRLDNGKAFLEVHHRVRLADGGDDTVENAMAVCPNCHRQAHYG